MKSKKNLLNNDKKAKFDIQLALGDQCNLMNGLQDFWWGGSSDTPLY